MQPRHKGPTYSRGLYCIRDTQRLALLIDERDEILENLEIAETRYILSFRLSTPDPSIADFQPPPPVEPLARPYISRPRVLRGSGMVSCQIWTIVYILMPARS